MKKFIPFISRKIEDFRIYTTLIIFSIFVAVTGVLSYVEIKGEISKLGSQFRYSMSKEITFSTNEWIKTRMEKIYSFASIVSHTDFIYDEAKMFAYLRQINHNKLFFDHYQILFINAKLAFDGKEIPISKKEFDEIKIRKWYKDTIDKNTTTITVFERHELLKTEVINVCTPIYQEDEITAVFCGIIKKDKFFDKIRPQIHAFVDNAYIFDENGDVIASIKALKSQKEIKKAFLQAKKLGFSQDGFLYNSNFIGITKLQSQNWYIGVSVNEAAITSSTLQILLKNGVMLFALFICLILFSNFIHTFIRNKILKKQKEYEVILSHELKMSETGELISAISHQLKQPLNSSMLLLSNTLALKNDGEISDEELLENLELCIKSNKIMNETIENFRNFYKFNDDIKEFDLQECIKNLLGILHVQFSRYNIAIKVESFDIKIKSNESFLQQILLVLLQNSKDALSEKNSDKLISIDAKVNDEMVEIYLSDNGAGLSKAKAKTIFNKYKSSSKTNGSGIGLYLSKIIAQNKLGGDLSLYSYKLPTTFKLIIKKYMEK
ncbi:sensor histidine kinase [Campylobacter geochelonis]|uniref:histidine kinase n=1 Tax=Campylobacter geochelonis TaxID=1780362 RepID=A0A128EG61_9BACT|nr:sensor histidine kinase [Campylobacter geochelonis]QKF71769.1 two-component system sensor histidine kinase [Campylobacter geochelonis]CZE47551.1 histidine kinase A domain-containing protein [Campylobacter geochelonis]CZE48481.1 histidine kinase A domain-containing protein [Campylobacter geochelonis]CZE51187.1 histidine kinase A domain-containing protein [Campylobacter geochelonis]